MSDSMSDSMSVSDRTPYRIPPDKYNRIHVNEVKIHVSLFIYTYKKEKKSTMKNSKAYNKIEDAIVQAIKAGYHGTSEIMEYTKLSRNYAEVCNALGNLISRGIIRYERHDERTCKRGYYLDPLHHGKM